MLTQLECSNDANFAQMLQLYRPACSIISVRVACKVDMSSDGVRARYG